MDQPTHATHMASAPHAQGNDDTIEVRTLGPHEIYRKCLDAQDTVDLTAAEIDEVLR